MRSHLFGLSHTTLLLLENKPKTPQPKHFPGCLVTFIDILICPHHFSMAPPPPLWDPGFELVQNSLGPLPGVQRGQNGGAQLSSELQPSLVFWSPRFPWWDLILLSELITECRLFPVPGIVFGQCVLDEWRIKTYSLKYGLWRGS